MLRVSIHRNLILTKLSLIKTLLPSLVFKMVILKVVWYMNIFWSKYPHAQTDRLWLENQLHFSFPKNATKLWNKPMLPYDSVQPKQVHLTVEWYLNLDSGLLIWQPILSLSIFFFSFPHTSFDARIWSR